MSAGCGTMVLVVSKTYDTGNYSMGSVLCMWLLGDIYLFLDK